MLDGDEKGAAAIQEEASTRNQAPTLAATAHSVARHEPRRARSCRSPSCTLKFEFARS
jgi:hypothetical protein